MAAIYFSAHIPFQRCHQFLSNSFAALSADPVSMVCRQISIVDRSPAPVSGSHRAGSFIITVTGYTASHFGNRSTLIGIRHSMVLSKRASCADGRAKCRGSVTGSYPFSKKTVAGLCPSSCSDSLSAGNPCSDYLQRAGAICSCFQSTVSHRECTMAADFCICVSQRFICCFLCVAAPDANSSAMVYLQWQRFSSVLACCFPGILLLYQSFFQSGPNLRHSGTYGTVYALAAPVRQWPAVRCNPCRFVGKQPLSPMAICERSVEVSETLNNSIGISLDLW